MTKALTTPVRFHYITLVNLLHRTLLKKEIARLFKKEGKTLESLHYIFCSDDYLLGINQAYLKHDDYTDIITFDLSNNKKAIKGEIYISIDRVRENAATYKVSFQHELLRVIFHGALHLCGYKDKKPKDIEAMRKGENRWLAYFLSHIKQ